jgi:hypothetical protein
MPLGTWRSIQQHQNPTAAATEQPDDSHRLLRGAFMQHTFRVASCIPSSLLSWGGPLPLGSTSISISMSIHQDHLPIKSNASQNIGDGCGYPPSVSEAIAP